MRRRLAWLCSSAILIAHRADPARHDAARSGRCRPTNFSSLAYKIGILVFVGGTVLTLFRERFAQALTAAMIWVVVALLLVVGYTYRFELHEVADRVLAELIPGHVVSHGRTVEVARSNGGDFAIARRSTARASPWCSIPARVRSC